MTTPSEAEPGDQGRAPAPVRATRRVRGDAGQTSADYLGILAVVVVVVSALLVGTTGIGKHVSAGIQAAICRINGGGCTVSQILHEPDEECEVYTHSGELSADVILFSVSVGGSAKLTLSKTVDPDGEVHWYVQQEGGVRLGADFLFGQEAKLGDLGEGVSAEVAALATAGAGAKMEFASEKEARDFMTAAAHEPVKDAMTGWDPTGITKWVADKIDGHTYDPPEPTEYFFEGGLAFEGSLDAKAGVGGAGGSAGVAGVVGVKVTPQKNGDPHKTIYMAMTGEAAAELGLLGVAKASGSVDGKVVVGIEYDGEGRPVKASVEAAGTVKGGFGPDGDIAGEGTIAQLAGFAPTGAPGAGVSAGGGFTGKITFTLDLTEQGNADALADGLHSIGVPVLRDYGRQPPPSVRDSLGELYNRFDEGADGTTITVTTHDVSTSGGQIGVKAGDGLTFGAEGGLEFEDTTLNDGYYYSPGDGFVNWQSCDA